MRSCKEMRQDAWNILTGSKWGWKILLNGIVLYAILLAVMLGLNFIFEAAGIQTFESFREAQREAQRSGVTLTIASGYEFLRMTFASGFSTFVEYLFQGIVVFGLVTTLVKCIKDDPEGWFTGAFGGFKRPFDLLWITLLLGIKVVAWALIFAFVGGFIGGIVSAVLRVCGAVTEKQMGVLLGCMCGIPACIAAIIASFRYMLTWYVKVENVEVGANACIKRSCELMYGRKWKLFFFWLSYIGWYILLIAPLAIASGVTGALSAAGAGASEDATAAAADESYSVVMIGALVVTILIGVFVVLYTAIGQAVFYRDAKAEVDATKEADPSEGVTA